MVFPYTVSKAWYSLINLLKRYSLTFINRTRHDKFVETGVMGGYKRLTYQKVVMDGMLKVRITFDNLRYLTIFVETKTETNDTERESQRTDR